MLGGVTRSGSVAHSDSIAACRDCRQIEGDLSPQLEQVLVGELIGHVIRDLPQHCDAREHYEGRKRGQDDAISVVFPLVQSVFVPDEAIRGNPSSSVAISGNPSSSVAISGHQWPSVAISGHQWPSVALRACGQVRQRVWPGSSGSVARFVRECGQVRQGVWPGSSGSVAALWTAWLQSY